MKVLIILAALGKEGISNSVITYLENMNREDIMFSIVVGGPIEDSAEDRVCKIGIPVIKLPNRMKQPVLYFIKLCHILKHEKPDIMHVHGNSATISLDLFAGLVCGTPARIAHSRNSSCTHVTIERLMRPLFNRCYTTAFAVSKEAGEWLFGNREYAIIPNGKDLKRFAFNEIKRNEYRGKYSVEDKIVIGHVGNFNKQKNHSFLIDIFYKLQNISDKYELWLFGSDDGEKENIVNTIGRLKLSDKIKLFDYQPNIEDYLSAMDIMLLPSLYEGMPNVVIEWQINDLPCIISDNITRDCKVTDLVKYIAIDDSNKWVNAIMDENRIRESIPYNKIELLMQEAGFDIVTNASNLKALYQNIFLEKGGN